MGRGFGQPSVHGHVRELGMRWSLRSLPIQTIPRFYKKVCSTHKQILQDNCAWRDDSIDRILLNLQLLTANISKLQAPVRDSSWLSTSQTLKGKTTKNQPTGIFRFPSEEHETVTATTDGAFGHWSDDVLGFLHLSFSNIWEAEESLQVHVCAFMAQKQ